ncbi:MAG: VOC family protein [Actinomycetota bacterium]
MLGPPVQIAYVVDDAWSAAERMGARYGIGPFVVIDRIELEWGELDGDPCDFVHSSAYGWWGDVMIELVQADTDAPSPFHPPYARPAPAIHHVAVMVDSFADTVDWCERNGLALAARAMTASERGTGTEFAFVDTRAELGHLTEIYERTPRLVGFFEHVRSLSVDGDGSAPLRPA